MSTGQSIFAIAALVVITFLVVSANRIINQSYQDELKGEAYNQAGEIANDLINEAKTKKYDDPTKTHQQYVDVYTDPVHKTGYLYSKWITYKIYDVYEQNYTTNFTPIGSLGPEGTEKTTVPHPDRSPFKSITGYDDYDDYNGYTRVVDTPNMTGFIVNCTVSYIASLNLLPAGNSTYTKKLVVKVSQPIYLPDTLTFSATMTY